MSEIEYCFDLISAQINHSEILFEWVNEPDVRINALNSSKISWDEHCKWFQKKIQDPHSKIYILKLNNVLIGQIRFDYYVNFWLIDYSIDKEYRGKGYGKKIIQLGILKFSFPVTLVAQVKETNNASLKVFKQLGFSEKDHSESLIIFEKKIEN